MANTSYPKYDSGSLLGGKKSKSKPAAGYAAPPSEYQKFLDYLEKSGNTSYLKKKLQEASTFSALGKERWKQMEKELGSKPGNCP